MIGKEILYKDYDGKIIKGKITYSLFRSELLEWYRSNKPNSGLPSEIVIGILYDKYLAELRLF